MSAKCISDKVLHSEHTYKISIDNSIAKRTKYQNKNFIRECAQNKSVKS